MDEYDNNNSLSDEDNVFEVIDIRNIQTLLALDEKIDDEIDVFNMTSLNALMLLNHASTNCSQEGDGFADDDHKLHRLSLAYERLHSMPKILLQELAYDVKILDLSHNEFDNLDFLSEFENLTTLICDHNNITAATNFPYLPKLELLWMNHCRVSTLYPWAKKLQLACPGLKYLSLMGNPAAPSYLNGGNFYEYLQYRLFIISLFPNLIHLDDRPVTDDQRNEAKRMYYRPLVERLVTKSQTVLPAYLRSISGAVSSMLTPTPPFAAADRNIII